MPQMSPGKRGSAGWENRSTGVENPEYDGNWKSVERKSHNSAQNENQIRLKQTEVCGYFLYSCPMNVYKPQKTRYTGHFTPNSCG